MSPEIDIARDLFGLEGYDVVGSVVDDSHAGARVSRYKLSLRVSERPLCPVCGQRAHKNGNRKTSVVGTPVRARPSLLEVSFPRWRCPSCGAAWAPELPGVVAGHRMTEDAYLDIAQRSMRGTFEEVTRDYPVTPVTVGEIFDQYAKHLDSCVGFQTPAFMGIDEILLGDLGFITVITDLEHRTIYDMLPRRDTEGLTAYFSALPSPESVIWVCTDMYRPFERSISTALPNARWTVDHFHVVMRGNDAVDDVRKKIQKNMDDKARKNSKRWTARMLKTRRRDLSAEAASVIRELRRDDDLAPLAVAFDLKEDFFDIYDESRSRSEAEEAFEKWTGSIPPERIYAPFRRIVNTVNNFQEQIFSYWDCPLQITNAYTEASNRVIREINMQGRGYAFDRLRAKVLYRKVNLENASAGDRLILGPSFVSEGTDLILDPRNNLPLHATTGELA